MSRSHRHLRIFMIVRNLKALTRLSPFTPLHFISVISFNPSPPIPIINTILMFSLNPLQHLNFPMQKTSMKSQS